MVTFSLDTGANLTVLTKETLDDLQLPLMIASRVLMGAGEAPLQVVGKTNVCLESRRKFTFALVSVVQGARCNSLGRDQNSELDLLAIVNAISSEAFDPLKQFLKLFTGLDRMPYVSKLLWPKVRNCTDCFLPDQYQLVLGRR